MGTAPRGTTPYTGTLMTGCTTRSKRLATTRRGTPSIPSSSSTPTSEASTPTTHGRERGRGSIRGGSTMFEATYKIIQFIRDFFVISGLSAQLFKHNLEPKCDYINAQTAVEIVNCNVIHMIGLNKLH